MVVGVLAVGGTVALAGAVVAVDGFVMVGCTLADAGTGKVRAVLVWIGALARACADVGSMSATNAPATGSARRRCRLRKRGIVAPMLAPTCDGSRRGEQVFDCGERIA